jgi:CRP/FNR family transcriptional regulator, cyclic AMP receptor protein
MASRFLETGEDLIAEGDGFAGVFELRSGTLEVLRGDELVAVVAEPGSLFGEMSLLLDRPASATVRARTAVEVAELVDARDRLEREPEFAIVLARNLARKVDTMTGYLADLRSQYADHDGGLGMVGEVLATLSHSAPLTIEPGSEREPDAPY